MFKNGHISKSAKNSQSSSNFSNQEMALYLQIIDPYHCYHQHLRFWKELFLINYILILQQMDFSMEVNIGFVNVTQPNLPH